MGGHEGYTIDRGRVTWDEIDGETLIINVETGYYFSLDGVGSLIWSLLAAGVDKRDIVARIVSEFDVEGMVRRFRRWAQIEACIGFVYYDEALA
jgi:hypothetical protein